MVAWISVTGQMGLSYPGSIDSVQCTAVGTVARFRNETLGEGEFIYLAGAADVAAGSVCSYEIDYNASVATSTVALWAGSPGVPLPLAVATAATVADTFGWYQVGGSAVVNCSGDIAEGDDLFWQAAGVVSATDLAGLQMMNAVAASADDVPDADQVIVTIDRPLAQGGAEGNVSIVEEATTARTLAISDAGKYISFTNAGATTLTVPLNATVAFPIGGQVTFEQAGAGTVTVDPAMGVTVNAVGAATDTSGQYAVAGLIKVDTDTWTLFGSIA